MFHRAACISAAAAVAACVAAAIPAGTHGASPQPLMIFVLAGQSNMAGNDQTVPPETAFSRVFDVTFATLKPAIDPLGDATGYGPGRFIGEQLAQLLPNDRIGLVMCAVGSTPLSRWVPGGDLYQRCVQRAAAARETLGGTLAGMFFAQGENDAESQETASTWASRFAAMVPAFRAAVGVPALPVVFSQLGQDPTAAWATAEFPYWDVVRAQQATVDLADTMMLYTQDIPSDVHYDWGGYQQLGVGYADAWLLLGRVDAVDAARAAARGGILGEAKNEPPFVAWPNSGPAPVLG